MTRREPKDAADPQRRTFEYIGHVYMPPGGRGVLLLDLPRESNFGMIQLDPQHGYYRAVLRFVPIPPVSPRLHLPEPE